MAAAVDPISVDVSLAVTVDGYECSVWTEDDAVVVNVPSLSAVRALLDSADAVPLTTSRLGSDLARADLVVELRVRHAPVARFGTGVVPSRLADLAGYDVAVSLRGLATGVWRALL
jgi:hypothetical protein